MTQGLVKVHGSEGNYLKARQGPHYTFKLEDSEVCLAAVPNHGEDDNKGRKRRKPEEGEDVWERQQCDDTNGDAKRSSSSDRSSSRYLE